MEWIVYLNPKEVDYYSLPQLSNCSSLINRIGATRDDFQLKSIQSYEYENYNSWKNTLMRVLAMQKGEKGRP